MSVGDKWIFFLNKDFFEEKNRVWWSAEVKEMEGEKGNYLISFIIGRTINGWFWMYVIYKVHQTLCKAIESEIMAKTNAPVTTLTC